MDFGILNCSKIIEFDLKWVHMARYELILRLGGALWLRIIFKPLLTPKGAIKSKKHGPTKSRNWLGSRWDNHFKFVGKEVF